MHLVRVYHKEWADATGEIACERIVWYRMVPMQRRPSPGEAFERLVTILDRLRDPGGCPWDREQTFDSLRPFLVEETAEALEALDARDFSHLAEELGDIALQIVFQARLAREIGAFDVVDVLARINEKMIRRHPHVFGSATASTAAEVLDRWDELKAAEGKSPPGPLGKLPPDLSALVKAQKTGEKAAKLGFDWPDLAGVWAKAREEMAELEQAALGAEPGDTRMAEELGDLLFTLTNLARHLGIDADQALNRATQKFRRRFEVLVADMQQTGLALQELGAEEKEAAWQRAKAVCKRQNQSS